MRVGSLIKWDNGSGETHLGVVVKIYGNHGCYVDIKWSTKVNKHWASAVWDMQDKRLKVVS